MGSFIQGTQQGISEMYSQFMDNADIKSIEGLKALILPHAGWTYSGQTSEFVM